VGGRDIATLIAALITFLPGATLTTATVELASGEMIAGASRLLSIALGVLCGVTLYRHATAAPARMRRLAGH
jgi:uncharacterized membrane protein YjjP (DUF1212 family)